MKWLIDENIPSAVVEFLKNLETDVKTIDELVKTRVDDLEIAELAEKENRVLLTLDLDFGYIYYFEKRGLMNIVITRVKPATPENIIKLLMRFFDSKIEPNGLVVVSEKKIRVLR